MENKIIVEGKTFILHPVYNLYGASEDGYITHIIKNKQILGTLLHSGYLNITVRRYGESNYKSYGAHRFIWECFNGEIPVDKEIDHINNIKTDNRLINLQLLTHKQTWKKSANARDYSFTKHNHQNKKCVKAVNIEPNEELYYNSMYACQQHLIINSGIIKMCAEGKNHCKSGISKKDGKRYKFSFVDNNELPEDVITAKSLRANKKLD